MKTRAMPADIETATINLVSKIIQARNRTARELAYRKEDVLSLINSVIKKS